MYLTWLKAGDPADGRGDPLADPHARNFAIRDYRQYLLTVAKASPATINTTLAAVASFHAGYLRIGAPDADRVDPTWAASRALADAEAHRLLREAERCGSARDRALVVTAHATGLQLAELAALGVDDTQLTARKGRLVVRASKGNHYREVPLAADAHAVLETWLDERTDRWASKADPALWLSREGRRFSQRSVQLVIGRIAATAGLELSSHTLRHTAATRWVRAGTDLVTVAELLGHATLDTTRRYTLSNADDLAAAVERGRIDY